MKIFVSTIISLLVGFAIGFYIRYRYCEWHQENEAMRAMVESLESHDALLAAKSANTVRLIDSGQDQKAVQMLSFPIASYYYVYASSKFTNAQRLKLRAMIDDVAKNNRAVADQIAEEMSNKPSFLK